MIKLDSVSEQTEQGEQREGYVFHCHNCGLYLDGIVAYKEGYMLNINGNVGYFPKEFIEEAISKRIKVKPISDHAHIHAFYYCPDCKHHIGDEPEVNNPCLRPNHCQHCGQAFDWGDVE